MLYVDWFYKVQNQNLQHKSEQTKKRYTADIISNFYIHLQLQRADFHVINELKLLSSTN